MARIVGVFQTSHTPFCYRRPPPCPLAIRGG
jgi:hypothetical protein